MFKHIISLCVGLAAALFAPFVNALQTIDVKDQRAHMVKISAREMTRLAVADGKIRRLDYVTGELEVKKDPVAGHYLLVPNTLDKPINVFVTTDSGQTHALVLQPTDMPLQNVILKEAPSKEAIQARRQRTADQANSLDASVKKLFRGMARQEQMMEYDVQPVNRTLALWDGTRFVLHQRYIKPDMTGERFTLQNLGTEVMRLSEQEFFQPGVIAVSIEYQILAPGETTEVYVARANNDG